MFSNPTSFAKLYVSSNWLKICILPICFKSSSCVSCNPILSLFIPASLYACSFSFVTVPGFNSIVISTCVFINSLKLSNIFSMCFSSIYDGVPPPIYIVDILYFSMFVPFFQSFISYNIHSMYCSISSVLLE